MSPRRPAAPLEIVDVAAGRWQRHAADLTERGARFLGLWTDAHGRVVLASTSGRTTTIARVAPVAGVVASVVDAIPAAAC